MTEDRWQKGIRTPEYQAIRESVQVSVSVSDSQCFVKVKYGQKKGVTII